MPFICIVEGGRP